MQNLLAILRAKIHLVAALSPFLIAKSAICQVTTSNLKIDTTITGFHFAADYQGTYVFTLNGKDDLKKQKPKRIQIIRTTSFMHFILRIAPRCSL